MTPIVSSGTEEYSCTYLCHEMGEETGPYQSLLF